MHRGYDVTGPDRYTSGRLALWRIERAHIRDNV